MDDEEVAQKHQVSNWGIHRGHFAVLLLIEVIWGNWVEKRRLNYGQFLLYMRERVPVSFWPFFLQPILRGSDRHGGVFSRGKAWVLKILRVCNSMNGHFKEEK